MYIKMTSCTCTVFPAYNYAKASSSQGKHNLLYPASKQQSEQIVSKSKTPAKVFRDSRVVYMYTIGLDTDQGTLRELTADELPDADRLPDGEYV